MREASWDGDRDWKFNFSAVPVCRTMSEQINLHSVVFLLTADHISLQFERDISTVCTVLAGLARPHCSWLAPEVRRPVFSTGNPQTGAISIKTEYKQQQ